MSACPFNPWNYKINFGELGVLAAQAHWARHCDEFGFWFSLLRRMRNSIKRRTRTNETHSVSNWTEQGNRTFAEDFILKQFWTNFKVTFT